MENIVKTVNDIVWCPALVVILVGVGIYFSIRTGLVQVRRIGLMIRLIRPKKGDGQGISSFEAMCIALSGRVGTGNIIGVATAIAFGGPGAVFWMWVIAFFGASTAFVESTLSQIYKFRHNGIWRGGPFAYIEQGLKSRFFAILFAVITIVACGMFLPTVQANGMSSAILNSFNIKPLWSGIGLAAVLGAVIFGGIKRISRVASVVTPFMAAAYLILAIVVIVANHEAVPGVFKSIFTNAFGINPLCSGILGSTIMMGVKRGLFSNEAGQGTGAIPSASASVAHPVEQGLAQAFSVYVDTLLVCTATAIMILSTGTFNIFSSQTGEMIYAGAPRLGNNYVAFTQTAIDSVAGGYGSAFVGIALILFSYTTIMAYYFYTESSIIYLCRKNGQEGGRKEKIIIFCFKLVMIASVIFGTLKEANLIWMIGDIGVGMMAWINIIAILLLSPIAFKALKEYEKSIGRK